MPVCGNSFRLCQSDYMFWRKGQAKAMECNSFEDYLWNSLLRASLNSISIKTKSGCCREIRCLLCLFMMLWTTGLQKKKKKYRSTQFIFQNLELNQQIHGVFYMFLKISFLLSSYPFPRLLCPYLLFHVLMLPYISSLSFR